MSFLIKSNSEVYALSTSHLPNGTNFSFFFFFFKGLQHLDIRFDMDTLTNLRNIWQSNIFLFLFPTITRDSIKTTHKEIFFQSARWEICMCKWGKNAPHHKYMYFIHNDHIYMSHIGNNRVNALGTHVNHFFQEALLRFC